MKMNDKKNVHDPKYEVEQSDVKVQVKTGSIALELPIKQGQRVSHTVGLDLYNSLTTAIYRNARMEW